LPDYVRVMRASSPTAADESRVGVIVAQGMLLEGSQPAGRIGGDSLSALIRQVRRDSRIRALVLRIDSPGGSAFASDQIRRELELTRLAGLPVVISMSSVAASGGYWIATAADEIWASPTTITGSIGIFSAFPTFEKALDAIGIRNDGVGTTRLADAFNPYRPMNPLLAQSLEQLMQQGYRIFIDRVAAGRNMTTQRCRENRRRSCVGGATRFGNRFGRQARALPGCHRGCRAASRAGALPRRAHPAAADPKRAAFETSRRPGNNGLARRTIVPASSGGGLVENPIGIRPKRNC
jgi:protease IV